MAGVEAQADEAWDRFSASTRRLPTAFRRTRRQCGWKTVRRPVASRTARAMVSHPRAKIVHSSSVRLSARMIRPGARGPWRIRAAIVGQHDERRLAGRGQQTCGADRRLGSGRCADASASRTGTKAPSMPRAGAASSAESACGSVGMKPQSPSSSPRSRWRRFRRAPGRTARLSPFRRIRGRPRSRGHWRHAYGFFTPYRPPSGWPRRPAEAGHHRCCRVRLEADPEAR